MMGPWYKLVFVHFPEFSFTFSSFYVNIFFFFALSDLFSFFKIILFIYLFLAVLGLHCAWDFSLVAASKGYSLVGVQGSNCLGFSCCGAWVLGVGLQLLQHTGLIVAVPGL